MFYQIIIYPIEFIIEIIFLIFQRILYNPGISIIGVSLGVQILSLPLYNIAEKWQVREREIQKHLKPKIDKIKAVFKGDEQYMILSTYYKQQHYHPIFALRSTVSLLIQVPFFIAAYTFLSNLEILQGQSFYFIRNLGTPDALLTIGSFTVNILPILMTLINVIAGAVYTKGFPIKEKIQLYAMAVLFLVLLYNSPSGLVLYWTLNNIFSLAKNIVNKAKKPAFLLYILACISCSGSTLYVLLFRNESNLKELLVCSFAIFIVLIPFFIRFARFILGTQLTKLAVNGKYRNKLFAFSCAGLFLLAGLLIPSALMASSPQEFSFIDDFSSPVQLLGFPLFQAAGFFLFWIPAIYVLFSNQIKTLLTWMIVSLFVIVLINTFILTDYFGLISPFLKFDSGLVKPPELSSFFIDFITIFCGTVATLLLIKFCSFKLSLPIFALMSLALFFLSGINFISIQKEFLRYQEQLGQTEPPLQIDPIYNLSKDTQNVVIIMLDRAISSFVPQIFEELPKTAKQFDGFTWYPNTLAVNGHTVMGAPPLYGGYEYLPEEINKRPDETLANKHNEALSVLPVLFLENGFSSTITDPSWANHRWIPDNSIFSPWPEITAKNIQTSYTTIWANEHNMGFTKHSELLKRNLVLFSFFRMMPPSIREGFYDEGEWLSTNISNTEMEGFIDKYSALDYLPELTNVDSNEPSFNVIVNEATHDSLFLQYPDYEPAENVTNVGPNSWSNEFTHKTYHTNIASLKKLGEWFAFLRQNNVYDNTRIIIVADHGFELENLYTFSDLADFVEDPAYYNPLLMVKDFNIQDPVQTDMTFMTIADVPFLATEGIIENPQNPFTDKPFSTNEKANGINIYTTHRWEPALHNKNTFILDDTIWRVNDNLFIPENWSKVQ